MAKSLADVLAKARQKTQQFNKERPTKPSPGKSVWRILPGWNPKDPNQFFHPFGQHFIKDLEGNIKAVLVCPEKTFDQPCEICDMIGDAVRAATDDDTIRAIKESRSTQSYLLNAVHVDGDGGVKILSLGTMAFNSLIEAMEEYPDLLDPEEGQDIVISRDGTGINTKYSITVRAASKSKPVAKSALSNMHDLDEYVKEDFEAKKTKAIETLGGSFAALGVASAAKPAALAAPDAADLDDELPDFGDEEPDTEADTADDGEAEKVVDAEVLDDVKEEDVDTFGEDMSEDDLDELLKDL